MWAAAIRQAVRWTGSPSVLDMIQMKLGGGMMPEWIAKYWVEWLFGVIAALVATVYTRLTKRLKAEQAKNKA